MCSKRLHLLIASHGAGHMVLGNELNVNYRRITQSGDNKRRTVSFETIFTL